MPNTRSTGKGETRRHTRHIRRGLLMGGICVAFVLYATACFLVYANSRQLQRMEKHSVSEQQAISAERFALLHDSEFFRVLAEKLAYYKHRPETLGRLYSLSLRKAPSSHQAFFSYAYYVSARNCCREQLELLLKETVRRCPTHPKMQRIAATYFLSLNEREKAMPLIQKALDLDPASAPDMFRMLEQNGSDMQTLVRVTPDSVEALIQLAYYLARNKEPSQDALQKTLMRLNSLQLAPDQRIKVADLAWSAGLKDIARAQSGLASGFEETRAEALAQQAGMLWNDGKHPEAARMAGRAEQAYREQGTMDQAAKYAMEIASLQQNAGEKAEAKQQMLRILNDYPGYAPAHYLMAQYSRAESSELELYYLKKARDLDSDNGEYRKVYARRLLETHHIKEAESEFRDLLDIQGYQAEGYVGLGDCRLESGDTVGAMAILQQAVQRAATSPQIYFQMGQLYVSIGEYEKGALAYLEYARMTPDSVDGYNLAGDAYLNLGRYPYARDQYRKVLAKDPQNHHALNAISNLQLLGY